ncbi:hypothetical protein F8568_031935 [Actinomadura sp. LD22]|uniref:Thioesterase domain-containing protein n=1 Tax=Actinomadura physcomitrii TaxID=2650748 RepID=A0A6I4MJ24_9ACTN|nr:hotdog domain-containing protein [Actinomadura physcomitrii]MWA04900.1 hypothetical protein [Actinomadura physcomitrii]
MTHLATLARELHELANAARTATPSEDVTERVCALLKEARALLAEHVSPGPYAVEQLSPPGDGTLTWDPSDLRQTIPYSPLLGHLNPISNQAAVWADGDVVRGSITVSPIYAGPIDTVHGGALAALLDELASLAVLAKENVAYTQSLAITYRRPTPLGAKLELWGQTAGRTGDTFLTATQIRHAGKVTVSAVGVHKAAGRRDEAVYPEA